MKSSGNIMRVLGIIAENVHCVKSTQEVFTALRGGKSLLATPNKCSVTEGE